MLHARAALPPVLLVTLISLSGCMEHGQHTTEGLNLAKERMSQLKAGVDLQMAMQQFLAGDLAKASKSVGMCLAVAPTYAPGHVLKGRIQMEQGQLEAARQSFLTAFAADPQSYDAQYYLGIVSERFSQYEEALASYERASELDRGNPQYIVAASEMLVQLNRTDEAIALLNERRQDFAHNAAIVQSLGNLAVLRGDNKAAAQYYKEARLLAPDDYTVLDSLARAQFNAEQYAEAEFNLSVLANTDPPELPAVPSKTGRATQKADATINKREIKMLRARCLMALGRPADARHILDDLTADQSGGSDVQAWTCLGQVALQMNDTVRARQAAARLIAMAPTRSEGYMLRSMAQRAAGDRQGAMLSAIEAAKRATTDPTPALMVASLRYDAGDKAGALSAAQIALQMDKDNTTAQRLIALLEHGGNASASAEGSGDK